MILAIETSCDDTAAAVLRGDDVLSNVISSQEVHNLYGGIIPELASREHVKGIAGIVQTAMDKAGVTYSQLDAIAVTYGPGLAGSLVVGAQFAKGLALRLNKPLIPVHHIEAHLYSGYLEDPELPYPSISLVASGGHTSLFYVEDEVTFTAIGNTKDDAAGEAFDKVAKMLGLGYPGGPHIDRLAKQGNPVAYTIPRGLLHDGTFDFSFSGLKTAARRTIELHGESIDVEDLCASTQRAIVDVLVQKTMRAAQEYEVSAVALSGGVSANSELRASMVEACRLRNIRCAVPRSSYSVDNAAMIGFRALQIMGSGKSGKYVDESTGYPIVDFAINPHAMRSPRTVK